MMKTPKGLPVTQYDMHCSDYQGGVKIDFLSIEALDRIRKDLELLIEDGVIEKEKTLKETYNKTIHPDILEFENKRMWEMLCEGEIIDAFQYYSPQGKNAIAKIKPSSFNQLMDGNALMRLISEGVQPIDRYVTFKNNINLWYKEMKMYGLTDEEMEVMKKHLGKSYGIASTQESAMRLSMDKKISGFSLTYANKLRKAIAKAYAKDIIKPLYDKWMNDGIELGNREVFLNYVWQTCIVPMLSYSFSEPHLAGYTLILIQEMNLALRSLLHWKVACLCVNSGDINEEITKGTDYGSIAKAIASMEKGFVISPDINTSATGFRANIEKQKAEYGLAAINGISHESAKKIIENRPYTSFRNFYEKCVVTKIIEPSKVYMLIKGGCFDSFNPNRKEVMIEYINYLKPNKTKLTAANIPKLFEYRCIPIDYKENLGLYFFRKAVFTKENCSYMVNKTQGFFIVGNWHNVYGIDIEKDFFDCIEYDDNGNMCLSSKLFDKIYNEKQKPFMEWLASQEALDRFNFSIKNEVYNKYCSGSIAKWEMDSLSYYTNVHELEEIRLEDYFKIDSFENLDREPKKYLHEHKVTRRRYKRYELSTIVGVVVDKDKNKNLVTLSTLDGVVQVKLYRSLYANYDKKLQDDPSWFTRGNKLVITGYRREDNFIPKVYEDSVYRSPIIKVDMIGDKINIQKNRIDEDEYEIYSY